MFYVLINSILEMSLVKKEKRYIDKQLGERGV